MFFKLLPQILRGKSLIRALMNIELKQYRLRGQVIDIGGGTNPSYFAFLQQEPGTTITNIDGKHDKIDFEKDRLPVDDESADVVLLFNVLEHIYHYSFVSSEMFRIVKQKGRELGFVPFLVNYHPDPHDYFRYTSESLRNIFSEVGFQNITITPVGLGPLAVGYNMIVTIFPRIITVLLFPLIFYTDALLLTLKPVLKERYALGYLFELRK